MTSIWLFPAFLVFVLSAIFLWALGGAVFGRLQGISNLFRLPWLGYGVLLGGLQIAHLFSPIDHRFSRAFLIITAAGTLVVLFLRARWRSIPREAQTGRSKLVLFVVLAFCVFVPVFNACTKPACHYDLGLYYLQEIRWFETFPIVRGVGNLILNLGFNQSALLITSLVDTLLPERIGLWLVGGFLPWLGLTLSIYAAVRLLAARKVRRSRLEVAYAISLPAWIYTLLGNNISSGSPDVTSSCLLIHLFLTFAAFVMTADQLERARLFGDLWILSALSVCLKLNTLGMVVGICFMAVLFLVFERDSCRAGRSYLRWSGAVAACLLGVWVYRGVLLSGYPLFPSRIAAVPVAWQIPPRLVDQCREDTVFWARIPYGERKVALEGLSWVGPWVRRVIAQDIQFDWPLGIGLVSSAAVLLLSWMETRLRRARYFLFLLCAPLFLHTLFWISTAPEPRYFGSTPWLFAAAPILSFIAAEQSLTFLCLVANLYLCAVPMAGLLMDTSWQWAKPDSRFPEIPRSKMVERTNPAGWRYFAPIEGNQSFDNTLPCANRSVANIGLLNPAAGISGGFRPMCAREGPRVGNAEESPVW
jgi:hypothetical protein